MDSSFHGDGFKAQGISPDPSYILMKWNFLHLLKVLINPTKVANLGLLRCNLCSGFYIFLNHSPSWSGPEQEEGHPEHSEGPLLVSVMPFNTHCLCLPSDTRRVIEYWPRVSISRL